MNYLFTGSKTLKLNQKEQNIAIKIRELLHVKKGLIKIDTVNIENNQRSFIPKTVSWIPGSILIDNKILYIYFLEYGKGEEYDSEKWTQLFNLTNRFGVVFGVFLSPLSI